MFVICGPGSERMGREIASILGVEASSVEHRLFPDGESHILIPEEVKGHDVFLVQSTAPP